MTAPLLYTVTEAAALLHVTPNWLEDRVSADAIPHRRLGRYIRFSAEDLALLIEQAAVKPVADRRKKSA